MNAPPPPGTSEHQRLLRAAAACYAEDPRVRAVALYGSLARGTWDEHSDVDLMVVTTDGVEVDVPAEVRRLSATFGQEPVSVERDGTDAADIVFPSLLEVSVRYHPLRDTTPFAADGVLVFAGSLDAATIQEAGRANRAPGPLDVSVHVDACVRQAIVVAGALRRRRFWRAYQVLYLARLELLQVQAKGRQGRPFHLLDESEPQVDARFRRTLPGDDLPSLEQAYLALLDVLEQDLPALSAGRARLGDAQRSVVAALRGQCSGGPRS